MDRRASLRAGAEMETAMDTMRILRAILLPPLAIFYERGFNTSFWLNLPLTALGYFPGALHALWVMADMEDEVTNRAATGTFGWLDRSY